MEDNKETNIENNKKQIKPGSFIKELLSGSMVSEKIILKNLGYVSLLAFLAAVYIGNRFHAEKITRESTRLQREVKDSQRRQI